MPAIKWIKITTDMFEDEKIKLIEKMPDADSLLIIWIKLICQAGKINDYGAIYLSPEIAYNDEDLATVLNRPINVVRLALTTFQRYGMIQISDTGVIILVNWEKHQNLDALEKIRQSNLKRIHKFREQHKQLSAGGAVVTIKDDDDNSPNEQIQSAKIMRNLHDNKRNESNSEYDSCGRNVTATLRNDIDKIRLDKIRVDIEEENAALQNLINEKRYDEIEIGTTTLAAMIRCLKGEHPCHPANLKLYREQIKALGIDLKELDIEEA